MSMVHDNVILSFNVDYEAETLTLLTEYHTEKLHEKTTIVFSDYLTHIFEHQQKNTIILDIEEESSEYFVESNKSFLEQSVNYGYPIAYQTKNPMGELGHYLIDRDYKTFLLSSSYGMGGWIVAKKMTTEVSTLRDDQ